MRFAPGFISSFRFLRPQRSARKAKREIPGCSLKNGFVQSILRGFHGDRHIKREINRPQRCEHLSGGFGKGELVGTSLLLPGDESFLLDGAKYAGDRPLILSGKAGEEVLLQDSGGLVDYLE